MATWQKTPAAVADAFHAALPDDPRLERRKMFGYPCAFVNGNMVGGTFADRLMVRMPESQREPGMKPFEPMAGRPMKEYVEVPEAVASDPAQLKTWFKRAFELTAAMPAKEAKPKKAKGK